MFQSLTPCRGAALGRVSERNLLSAAENELLPLQTRASFPSASVAALSVAELNTNLPDLYLQDEVEAIIPERFHGLDLKVVQQLSKSQHATLWELHSDLSSLSVRAGHISLKTLIL